MGQSTAAFIPGNNAVMDIFEVLRKNNKVENLRVMPTSMKDYVQICFDWAGDSGERNLSVFFNGSCRCDYEGVTGEPHTMISFGYWGSAVEIMETILEELGGFIQVNDCGPEPDCSWVPYEEYKVSMPVKSILDKLGDSEYSLLKEYFLKGDN